VSDPTTELAARPTFPAYVDRPDLEQRVVEIAQAGLDQRLLLLIGAGFSKDARGYPVGSELASVLIRDVYHSHSDADIEAAARKYELAAISQQYVEKATEKRQQLLSRIGNALSKVPKEKSQVELDLATVASICRLRRVFTTNFDSVIEESLDSRAVPLKPTISDIRTFEERVKTNDVTGIMHLNGGVSDAKLTENDLRGDRSIFFEILRQSMLTDVLVMIGYSFRDDAVTQIYDELFDLLKAVGQDRRSYIVMPVDNELDYRLGERLWRSRGDIVLLPLRAGEFLRMLVSSLEEVRYEGSVRGIAEQIGTTPADIHDRLRPLKDKYAHISSGELAEAVEEIIQLRKT